MIKPVMKYRVVQGRNPRTGGTIPRPLIVDRETYYIDQFVQYALNTGYVRGQFHDMCAALGRDGNCRLYQRRSDGQTRRLDVCDRPHRTSGGIRAFHY